MLDVRCQPLAGNEGALLTDEAVWQGYALSVIRYGVAQLPRTEVMAFSDLPHSIGAFRRDHDAETNSHVEDPEHLRGRDVATRLNQREDRVRLGQEVNNETRLALDASEIQ